MWRWLGFIAAIAVILAIVTHLGNETNNEKILAHVDAQATKLLMGYETERIANHQAEETWDGGNHPLFFGRPNA
jgi:hypothetical protein